MPQAFPQNPPETCQIYLNGPFAVLFVNRVRAAGLTPPASTLHLAAIETGELPYL
jgi:hypothetical protein